MATEMSSIRPFFALWCKTNYSHSFCPQNTKTSDVGKVRANFDKARAKPVPVLKKEVFATFLIFPVPSRLTFKMQTDQCVVSMILFPGSVPGSVSGTLPSRCLSTLIWSLKVILLSDSGQAAASWQPLPCNGTFHLLVMLIFFAVFDLFSGCPFYSKPGQASCNTPWTL